MAHTRKMRKTRNFRPKTLFQGSQYFKATSIVNGKTVEDTELRENVDNNQQVIEGHIGSKPVHIRRRLGYPRSTQYMLVPFSKNKRKIMTRRIRSLNKKKNRYNNLSSRRLSSRKLSSRKLKPLRFDI